MHSIFIIDFGEPAEVVVKPNLKKNNYHCILIGTGIRDVSTNLILFEKLFNVYKHTPKSMICFHVNPLEALVANQRWAWFAHFSLIA